MAAALPNYEDDNNEDDEILRSLSAMPDAIWDDVYFNEGGGDDDDDSFLSSLQDIDDPSARESSSTNEGETEGNNDEETSSILSSQTTTTKTKTTTTATATTTTEELEKKFMALSMLTPESVQSSLHDVVGGIQRANYSDLDAILANEMEGKLSLRERERKIQLAHGIAKVDDYIQQEESSPLFIHQKLEELELQLMQIPSSEKKRAYERALYDSPEYVRSTKFRLSFLRGDMFDTTRAAQRIVDHFHVKMELFGTELLGRDISISDLEDLGALDALKLGAEQLLPERDRVDRPVACVMSLSDWSVYKDINKLRAYFYMGWAGVQDEEVQRSGFVAVALNVGINRISFEALPYLLKIKSIEQACPYRYNAFHYVYDQPWMYPFVTAVPFLFNERINEKFIPHYCSSQTEYKYKLQTYGIPTKDLPIDEEGNILTENHLQWIEQRRLIESQMSPTSLGDASPQSSLIMMPRRFDVLLGRGSRVSEHTGNLRAFHIVTMNREIYEKAGKFEKTRIAEKIVQLIQQSYGRFLEKGPGGCWIECDMEKSREKISHCFRRLRELDSRKASSDKAQTDTESELAGSRRRTRDQESVSVMKKHNSSL